MSDVEYAIETHELSRLFGNKYALRSLSLKLPRGGVHAVVGSNGAGKSTLFRILLGVLSPSAGHSLVLGTRSTALTPEVRSRVAFVHEEHALPGWMTVGRLRSMHRSLYPRWDETVYREVIGHYHVLAEQRVAQLSRGERAGVNLAMALAQGPELLILDEPTLGLDVVAKQAFLESLLFVGEGYDRTVLYCSHQMDEVERVAENLILMERGELVSISPLDQFCRRVSYWVADELPLPADPASIPGLLDLRSIEGQLHLVVLDQGETFAGRLTALGAREVRRLPLGFDRAVNAYLTRNHASPTRSETRSSLPLSRPAASNPEEPSCGL